MSRKFDEHKSVSDDTIEIDEILLNMSDDELEEENNKSSNTRKTDKHNKGKAEDIFEDYTVDTDDIARAMKEVSETERKKRNKRIRRTIEKSVLLVVELFVILISSFVLFMLVTPNSKAMLVNSWIGRTLIKLVISDSEYDNILDKDYDRQNMSANEGVNTEVLEKFTNIALFGLDSRYGELDEGVRSDTIIVVSINNETKEVKMCSVYRDNWLRVVKKDGTAYYGKINAAYAYGGPESAVKTLNQNLDLDITDYASVNFYGIARLIDMLGGIDVKITSTEQYWINQYLTETRKVTGIQSEDVYNHGNVHLNGIQATAFCRIRYTTFTDSEGNKYNDDFGRTARQRFVISQMVDKAKAAGVSKILELADEVFNGGEELVKTSIPYDELLDMIPVLMDFSITGQAGFPTTYTCPDIKYTSNESSVVAQGFSYNVTKMHNFLFGDYGYTPSKVVLGIDESIKGLTHVEEVTLPEDATLVEDETTSK